MIGDKPTNVVVEFFTSIYFTTHLKHLLAHELRSKSGQILTSIILEHTGGDGVLN